MAFKYRGNERKAEDVVRRSKQSGGSFDSLVLDGLPQYKPREGENCIRIMPPTWADTNKYGDGWEYVIYVHYGVGADGASYLCRNKMLKEQCPICDARGEMDEDEATRMSVKVRDLCWVIDRDNEKAGPQLWSMPPSVFRDINARSIDKKTGKLILVDDPEEGYDIVFTRVGTDMKTKYEAIEVQRDPSPLHESNKKFDEWIGFIEDHTLPECLNFYDAEYIEKVLFAKVDRRNRDEEDEDRGERTERSARSRRSNGHDEEAETQTRRGRSRSEPEEDEKPSRLGRAARAAAEEPEEDEDEKPSRSNRRRAAVEDEDPPSERSARSSRKRAAEDEDEQEEEEPEQRGARSGRQVERRRASEPEEGEEEEASPSKQARSKLSGLRERRSSR